MKKTTKLLSTDGQTKLNCLIWDNTESAPKVILQVVHGMAEYIERYESLANYLNLHNIVVVGHDHLGHGDSLADETHIRGYFSKGDSPKILIEDTHLVTNMIKEYYPEASLFILGHSMGSFIVRNYLKKYAQDVDGAIIMGTGGQRPELKLGLHITSKLNSLAPKVVNSFIDKIAFGNFSNYFPEKRTSYDWLSKNKANVDAYIADPKLGFTFTNNGFDTLFQLTENATKDNWADSIRRDLPIYIVSGEQDPVGNFGIGPQDLATDLSKKDFKNVTLQLYTYLRHEILNEAEHELVKNDLIRWINLQNKK
ncbi:alpha/beta fold hydrolase [Vagococcus intermedius]|uniref:Lysophospholipase n=1 Tax=Vagococcus intermedius TaxID=2991418 RepID=A0AAF0CWH5_9ENTE|nr:alpha/beta hydrolase [Vagococcus intermedius]WEG74127.1 lysophospholipase [Vagococcus intermedius]WEG76207.1 lysophospholipase [Vagococcus intermedius]